MTEIQEFNETVSGFESAFQSLISLAESYPEPLRKKIGVCGDWSAREVLAHFCGWMVEALRRFPRYATGTGEIQYNKDAFNEVSIWLRRDKDYEMILDELRDLSTKIGHFARDLPEHQIERNGHRYAEWLTNLTREAQEHQSHLENFAR